MQILLGRGSICCGYIAVIKFSDSLLLPVRYAHLAQEGESFLHLVGLQGDQLSLLCSLWDNHILILELGEINDLSVSVCCLSVTHKCTEVNLHSVNIP